MGELLNWIIAIVPLIAGLALFFVCGLAIVKNPAIPNSNVVVLGIGALLCVAPTILTLTVKLPGGGEISLLRQQIKNQAQQFTGELGGQGAELKREMADIKLALEAIAKQVGGTAAGAVSAAVSSQRPPAKVVLIIYTEDQKTLALRLESYLLGAGYAANAVFSDFSELSESSREKEGTVRFLYTEPTKQLADKLLSELQAKLGIKRAIESQRKTLAKADVEIQLF